MSIEAEDYFEQQQRKMWAKHDSKEVEAKQETPEEIARRNNIAERKNTLKKYGITVAPDSKALDPIFESTSSKTVLAPPVRINPRLDKIKKLPNGTEIIPTEFQIQVKTEVSVDTTENAKGDDAVKNMIREARKDYPYRETRKDSAGNIISVKEHIYSYKGIEEGHQGNALLHEQFGSKKIFSGIEDIGEITTTYSPENGKATEEVVMDYQVLDGKKRQRYQTFTFDEAGTRNEPVEEWLIDGKLIPINKGTQAGSIAA
jgi:hypothetical protein